jgi:SAM-dependent methyltransferase
MSEERASPKSLRDRVHARRIFPRRVARLAATLSEPLRALGVKRLLDVGCGDGDITRRVAEAAGVTEAVGVDVLLRPHTHLPVTLFDGDRLPYADGAWEAVMAVDVLHHAKDPVALLAEMTRVSARWVMLKDHNRDGIAAEATLRFMDDAGNKRHRVVLPYNYLSRAEWRAAAAGLGLTEVSYDPVRGLYPWPLSVAFGRGLHFVGLWRKPLRGMTNDQ